MTKLGVAAAAINAYIAARPALTAANALQEIITEKYIANFLKTEPWNDWRRTGFPVVPLVPQAVINTIPQRIRAPGSELSSNTAQVMAARISHGHRGDEGQALVGRRRQQVIREQENSLMHRTTALLRSARRRSWRAAVAIPPR